MTTDEAFLRVAVLDGRAATAATSRRPRSAVGTGLTKPPGPVPSLDVGRPTSAQGGTRR